LNGFTTGFNPLLIASRELVHYWKAYERVHAADADPTKDADSFETDLAALNDKEREPYVLLLIRPNGAVAFHIAKTFLSQLKVPHGYELITEDMEIDSSSPDPEAKQICQAAVTQVLAEREKVLQALARSREQQREQLQLDPDARTFVPKETNGSPTGFNRPKPSTATASSSTRSTLRPSGGGSGTTDSQSPRPMSGSAYPTAAGDAAAQRAGGSSAAAGQQREGSRPVAQTGTSRGRDEFGDEPSEEPLPRSVSQRFENDDSKPFPFSGDRTKSASSKNDASASPAGKSNGSRPGPRPSNSSSAANNSAAGTASSGSANNNNVARMKRRYMMPRSGIGLEKAIPIRISSRRVLVGEEFEIPIEPGVKTDSLIDRVLIAMDRVQTDWPSAGAGYHWVPTIKYEVVPGGEQVHQRLNSALFDLGLVSHVEFLDSDPDARKSSRETSRSRATAPAGGGAR
jgi:hypothetical protein